jgi:hypoxia up-regulated 1
LTNLQNSRALGTLSLSQVELKGIADALEKNQGPNVEAKGVKAHFNMDESGMLQLLGAELSFEKTVTEAEEKAKKEAEDLDGTFAKLGSTISKMFSGDEQKPEASSEEKVEDAEGATPTTTTPAPAAQNDSARRASQT